MALTVEIIPDPDQGGFTARLPDIPAYGEGETDPEKARKLLKYEKGGFPGQRLKPPQSYLDAGGKPAPPLGAA